MHVYIHVMAGGAVQAAQALAWALFMQHARMVVSISALQRNKVWFTRLHEWHQHILEIHRDTLIEQSNILIEQSIYIQQICY